MATLVTYDEIAAGGPGQGAQTLREIVMGDVVNVVSARRPVQALLGTEAAEALFFERLEDTLEARAHNAVQEGADFTAPDLTQPVRLQFIVQRFARWGQVSDEQRDTAHYTRDPFSYQAAKQMQHLLNDIELAVIRGSAVTGTSGTARQLQGLLNIFTGTVTTTDSSGTTYTERVLVDHLQVFPDNKYDVHINTAIVGARLKRTISEFSTKVTRNIEASARMQLLVVERHSSDFGDVDVVYSEDVPQSATVTAQGNSVIYLDREMFKVSWFKLPTFEQLSRAGFSNRFQETGQCTLTYRTAKAGGSATSYVANITQ